MDTIQGVPGCFAMPARFVWVRDQDCSVFQWFSSAVGHAKPRFVCSGAIGFFLGKGVESSWVGLVLRATGEKAKGEKGG